MFREIPNFFSPKAFKALREHRKVVPFEDVECPEDGVTYPRIATDLPDIVRREVAFHAGAQPTRLFLRESPAGVHVPHQVHHDGAMGSVAFMLYLEDAPNSGTTFVRHVITGVSYRPMLESLIDIVSTDANNSHAWAPVARCVAAPNKACIFDAGYFHRADPSGGYGEGRNARCVLTGFFQ